MQRSDFEPSPIIFGTDGELAFDSLVESTTADGSRVVQAVIYFWNRDGAMRGINIVDETYQTDSATDSEPSIPEIRVPLIDPDSILGIMQLPSEDILAMSMPIDEASTAPNADA